MKDRHYIAKRFGITEQYLSMLILGKRPVSWPLAERLAELFPGRTIQQWKNADPADLERVLPQIQGRAS